MTSRHREQTSDDFVIGGDYPAPPQSEEPVIGASEFDDPYDDDPWVDDEDYEDDYEYEPEPAYAPYTDRGARRHSPLMDVEQGTRAPAMIFLAGLVLFGGIGVVVAFLFLFGGDDDDPDDPTPTLDTGAELAVRIDGPAASDRIVVGESFDVAVTGVAGEAEAEVILYANDVRVDEEQIAAEPGEPFTITLSTQFSERGDYVIFVRLVTASGEQAESDRVALSAVESIEGTPEVVTGEVTADATARVAPNDLAEEVGTLNPGDEVTILGRTEQGDWLLVNSRVGQGIWVRRAAIRANESLEFVPVATPEEETPSETETPDETPTETPTPTPDDSLPDLLPVGAELSSDGTIVRVTVQNSGGSEYAGAVVVSVSGVDAGTLIQAFDVSIPPGESAVVEFALSEPVTGSVQADVTIDPDNAVPETSEGNNAGGFPVEREVPSPELSIVNVVPQAGVLVVAVLNDGGDLASSEVTVTIELDGLGTQRSVTIALPAGETQFFEVPAPPGSGVATITVLVDGVAVSAVDVTIPGDEPTEAPTEEPATEEPATDEPTEPAEASGEDEETDG